MEGLNWGCQCVNRAAASDNKNHYNRYTKSASSFSFYCSCPSFSSSSTFSSPSSSRQVWYPASMISCKYDILQVWYPASMISCLNVSQLILIGWLTSFIQPFRSAAFRKSINLLKPTGHVMHQQFNIQQLYVLSTLYLCVLYLSENKQRFVPLTA